MTLICIGIILFMVSMIGAIINITVAFRNDTEFERAFGYHAIAAVGVVISFALIAFGVLGMV